MTFSMRIFTINYYMANPDAQFDEIYSKFRQFEIKQVPILRVFGATSQGEKACLHVHNVFPYVLIRYFRAEEQLDRFMYDLAEQIDKTLNASIGQKADVQHVYKIEVIQAKSMYGYHEQDSSFLKIYLYHPDLVKRLSDLLVNGVIMNEVFQPFSAHVPYNLQFLIDHNLFGMNFIHLEDFKYRKGKTDLYFEPDEFFDPKWTDDALSPDLLLDEVKYTRQTICKLEIDCMVQHIMNPNKQKDDVNPGLSALWNDERKRRATLNLNGNITPPDSQDRENVVTIETENELKRRLIELLEERFNAKYPFGKDASGDRSILDASKMSQILSNTQIDDENILNILDSLHNDVSQEENDEGKVLVDDDEDNCELLQATQLDEEEKIQLLEENNEMTQKLELNSKGEEIEFDIENQDILNNSHSSSSSTDDDEDGVVRDDDEDEDEEETSIQLQQPVKRKDSDASDASQNKRNSLFHDKNESSAFASICWSDFEMDSQEFTMTPKPRRKGLSARGKYRGVKRMAVRVSRLDLSTFSVNKCLQAVNSHYCHYFKTRSQTKVCSHRQNHISQNYCIDCDFKTEHADSLEHMAFLSPVAKKLDSSEKPKFDSPTAVEDESSTESTTIRNDEDEEDTLVEAASDDATLTDSLASSADCTEDESEEQRRKMMLEKLAVASDVATVDDEIIDETMIEDDDGQWFCPLEIAPADLNNTTVAANDSIICYSTGNNKNWKLNVEEFKTRFQTKTNLRIKDGGMPVWFTPAIPFPSFERRVSKTKMTRRRAKLKKIHSETSQYDKCSIVSSNGSVTSTLTQIESEYSQFVGSVATTATTTKTNSTTGSTVVSIHDKTPKQPEKLTKRKSVRFADPEDEPEPEATCSKFIPADEEDSNLSSVSQSVHEKSHSQAVDYSEVSICDETLNNESAYLDSSKSCSFYEYNSMLMPKCTKFIDSLICTQDLTTTLIEPKLPSSQKTDFKHTSEPSSLATIESDFLTILSMELHVNTRESLQPNPEHDSIGFICYSCYTNDPCESHVIFFDHQHRSLATTRFICSLSKKHIKSIDYVYKEEDMIKKFIKMVQTLDPDILVGFEIQKTSWCFLVKRAIKLGIKDVCVLLSRLPNSSRESHLRVPTKGKKTAADSLDEVYGLPQDLVIAGRVVLNLWRVLRNEISLNIYTFENCCYHIMHERTPKYSYALLTSFYQHRTDLLRWRVIEYYAHRTETNIRMMSKLNLVSKTSEFARVYGIEFYHVLSRGSQYRVESMMLRIAKKLNYIPVSPSLQQKARMRAPECIPLTMEPESRFYTEPIAVLDFQSLYPSVIIAFNICYTTCLGRVESIGKDGCFKFGCTSLFLPDELVRRLDFDKDVYFAPSGVAFVKSHIRKGVLPIMLEDILTTRVMVKNSMKLYKGDKNLNDLLDSRQLSLKLIANVTFGYTAANFSGRMPCTEIGDTIVRQARQILENSIKFIHSNYHKYGGRVVYGDTDSMFVLFENCSKTKAFETSFKIVSDISAAYLKPVKLKFEKIYYPGVLISKKRYVGNCFETIGQTDAVIDAKGIETVRRDGCQVSAKILERALKILFEFKDADKVKNYVQRQCAKIIQGKVNFKDFIIAKEYRGRNTYANVKSVAACQIANRNLTKDPLAEPLAGERVPYVIAYGPPGMPLYELVRAPEDFLGNEDLKINYEYYIVKQILPPINRIMSLMRINAFDWVSHMSFRPKMFHRFAGTAYQPNNPSRASIGGGLTTLTKFLVTTDCMLCGTKCDIQHQAQPKAKQGLCPNCSKLDLHTIIKLKLKFKKYEKQYSQLLRVCKSCTSTLEYGNFSRKLECISLDCPNLYLCNTTQQHMNKHDYLRDIIDEYF